MPKRNNTPIQATPIRPPLPDSPTRAEGPGVARAFYQHHISSDIPCSLQHRPLVIFVAASPVPFWQTHTSKHHYCPAGVTIVTYPQYSGCRIEVVTWGRVDSTGRYPLDRGPWRRAPRKKRQKNKRRTRIRSRCLKRSDFRPNPGLAGWDREMKCQAAVFGSLVTNI